MTSHRGHHASTAGTSTAAGEDWRRDAACRDADPELFYPVSHAAQAAEDALAICAVCPVRETCLAEELERGGMQWGVRGGRTEAERRAMLRQKTRRRPAYTCAICGAGLSGRPKNGGFEQRYCSDACRITARRQQQNAYDQKRKREVAV